MVTQVPRGGLTSVEESLVEHVGRGEWLDLTAKGEVVDEAAMRSWGEARACRATVIRDILRKRLVADPDPHGLRLRGARISGRLDLGHLTTNVNLELSDCFLEEGLLAMDARLASVRLTGCQLEHPAEAPLYADRLICSRLSLNGARIIADADADADAVLRLAGAHIDGQLDFTGAALRNDSGPALIADGLQVGQAMFFRGGFTAIGAGELGAVRLPGAHIGGTLDCDGARLGNGSGPALNVDGLQVGQYMFLRGGFTAIGAGELGAVNLRGAHIGATLECTTGASLRNDSGPALYADNMQVGQGMLLRDGFTATGAGGFGAVRLATAHIGGTLDFTGAALRNDSGPALYADGLQVGLAMFLRGGFTATGAGELGAVRLATAHVGGTLDFTGAALRNDSGPALIADGLQVGQGMLLRDGFTATGAGHVTVNLTSARVNGALLFAPVELAHAADPRRRLAVDGLTYAGVPTPISARDWLRLLREGTDNYAAQPYQQVAAGYRALGDERLASEILMAQRDDQLTRTHPRRQERLWGRITKVTLGYGYRPWRALLFLVAVVTLSCVLAVVLGSHGALVQTDKTATPGRSCTVVQQVSVGLDLNLPVGTSVARADCDLTTDSASATAAWLSVAGWMLRLVAWAFAALFIAGFTSIVRKT